MVGKSEIASKSIEEIAASPLIFACLIAQHRELQNKNSDYVTSVHFCEGKGFVARDILVELLELLDREEVSNMATIEPVESSTEIKSEPESPEFNEVTIKVGFCFSKRTVSHVLGLKT